ncbi:MAG: hypothetical protein ABSG33_11460 [Candidatus Bathyarchaeia archaeon]|jgi:hypothetical protein
MLDKNLKKPIIAVFIVVSIFLTLFSANFVSASGGSIAMANAYPEDGATYVVVDHFIYQATAVNTNTTVSVSIDNGPLIPMAFQGIINEVVNNDTVARDWYTWQVTIPAITNPGRHTFQFFSHYYVWQDTDYYWEEFNARSTAQSFSIADSTPPKSTPTTTRPVPELQPVPEMQSWMIFPIFAVAIILSIIFFRKRMPTTNKP